MAFSEEVNTSIDDDHSDDKESEKEDDFEKVSICTFVRTGHFNALNNNPDPRSAKRCTPGSAQSYLTPW